MTYQTNDLPITLCGEAAWNPSKEAFMGCHNTGIHHVGLHATNPTASAEFYRDILGMIIVGGSAPGHAFGASAFLSSRPEEESHEIALFANPALAHIAFKVSSLAEFRSFHARVVDRSIPIKFLANHHTSFAFYFEDPDGHLIEVYWPTGDPLNSGSMDATFSGLFQISSSHTLDHGKTSSVALALYGLRRLFRKPRAVH